MLESIARAERSVRLETFIFHSGEVGDTFRAALVAAQKRGVRVRVMCDAFGSLKLMASYWDELVKVGGAFRWFNPLDIKRIIHRDHRKILVVDEEIAFIGGFNIGTEYCGDGVTCGWRDLGLRIEGPLARELADTFNDLFARADCRHRRFQRIRHTRADAVVTGPDWTLLLTGPGRGHRALKQSLEHDFERAKSIHIMSAYFLPNLRLLRELKRAAKRGAKVQLLLAGKSDVWLMRIATRGLYSSLLRVGIEIYEYRPQIMHAKVVVVDDVVYAGSANLDARSLSINYEVLARIPDQVLAEEARQIFAGDLKHSEPIEHKEFKKTRRLWESFIERWAFFLLARVDPYLARRQRHHLLQS
ncbi:MAG TPA: phosphatidylserine/phosphatidylglycerophosphate/cardiolipin synthase family protein [Candidatus Limnocylindria bacterium]|nr:phosphatidylserine/phosphatidylglycerophosphate/cardiolipin synthase family protein [Candidatus Limnocylindria bacterium]